MQKKALLTGCTGFIGSHLAEKLLEDNWEVHAIVRRISRIHEMPDFLKKNIIFHMNDQKHDLQQIVHKVKPVVVFHLASLFLSSHKYEDIDSLIESNVSFGTKLLNAMVENNVYNFVNTGTSWQHYENEEYNPVNLYAASKQAFEAMLRYYQEISPLRAITLKLFDTYGEGDSRRKLLALLKEISETGETLEMSPGEQQIDLVHVDDVVSAFLIATQYLLQGQNEYCGTYAVTTGTTISLRELVQRYEKVTGKTVHIEWGARPYREREVMVPWNKGKILPGWNRLRKDLM